MASQRKCLNLYDCSFSQQVLYYIYIIATKHELEELSQLADRITDVLFTGVNAVAAVTPTKANSAHSQMSAFLDRMEKLETFYRVASHRPRGILVAEII